MLDAFLLLEARGLYHEDDTRSCFLTGCNVRSNSHVSKANAAAPIIPELS